MVYALENPRGMEAEQGDTKGLSWDEYVITDWYERRNDSSLSTTEFGNDLEELIETGVLRTRIIINHDGTVTPYIHRHVG